MHTQLFESVMDKYNRELRIRRLKRAVAWCGVVALGSLLIFAAGVSLMQSHTTLRDLIVFVVIISLLAWGSWGFWFLKTRH